MGKAKGGAPRFSVEWLEEYEARKKGTARPHAPSQMPTMPKYHNQKVHQDGIIHDSKKEARRYGQLCVLERTGVIHELKRQVPFVLAPAVHLAGEARKKPAIRYLADFTYQRDGQLVVEDAKSDGTRKLPVYRIKKHLMKTVHDIDVMEV